MINRRLLDPRASLPLFEAGALVSNWSMSQEYLMFGRKKKISHVEVREASTALAGLAVGALAVAKAAAWFFAPSWGMALLIAVGFANPPIAMVLVAILAFVAASAAAVAGFARFYSWMKRRP